MTGLGPLDEDIAKITLVLLTSDIAESAQRVQRPRNYRLRNGQVRCQAANRMRSGREIDKHQKRQLAIGKIGTRRPHIGDQRVHPFTKNAFLQGIVLILRETHNNRPQFSIRG